MSTTVYRLKRSQIEILGGFYALLFHSYFRDFKEPSCFPVYVSLFSQIFQIFHAGLKKGPVLFGCGTMLKLILMTELNPQICLVKFSDLSLPSHQL